jgi:hypothetical protein
VATARTVARQEFACSKLLNINEDLAYKKITDCIDVTKLKATGKYSFKIKCKLGNKNSKI